MMAYTVLIGLKQDGPHFDDKKPAIRHFMDRIREVVQARTTWQFIDTTCWLEINGKYCGDFYTCRDQAIEKGWLEPGTGTWLD